MSDKQRSAKQPTTKSTEDPAEQSAQPFSLGDLARIAFTLDGVEHDAWSSPAAAFQQYIAQFSRVSNVDIGEWNVFERLDFLNALSVFCSKNGFSFPFTIKPLVEQTEQGEAET